VGTVVTNGWDTTRGALVDMGAVVIAGTDGDVAAEAMAVAEIPSPNIDTRLLEPKERKA
jgi:hypothetical protein